MEEQGEPDTIYSTELVFSADVPGKPVWQGGQATTDRESRKKPAWVGCEHIIYEDV